MVLIASITNCTFVILWKKSMTMTTPALFTILVGISVCLFGFSYYLIKPENLLFNTNYLQSENFTPINGFWLTVKWLTPVIICALVVSVFYLFNSHIYMTLEVSRAYPFIAIGTLITITLIGLFVFRESITINKITGIALGLIAIWFLTKK